METFIIVLLSALLFISIGLGFYMNYDWSKICNDMNEDWGKYCKEINDRWYKENKKLVHRIGELEKELKECKK